MFCKNCGVKLEENARFCPNCGANQKEETVIENRQAEYTPEYKKAPSYNTMAIVGFVISLISLFLNFFGLVGIAAVITSVIGLNKINTSYENGKALAIIGIVIGAASVLYGFIMLF